MIELRWIVRECQRPDSITEPAGNDVVFKYTEKVLQIRMLEPCDRMLPDGTYDTGYEWTAWEDVPTEEEVNPDG